jgi:stalled ribosome alternative rescue factor ArfA
MQRYNKLAAVHHHSIYRCKIYIKIRGNDNKELIVEGISRQMIEKQTEQ